MIVAKYLEKLGIGLSLSFAEILSRKSYEV